MTHVPYRGAGPAFNDLIPGRVDAMINFTSSSLPLVRQGQLRALSVTTAKRLSVAPEVPTMAEAGVPGVEVSSWSAFFVPPGRPRTSSENSQRYGCGPRGTSRQREAGTGRHRGHRLHAGRACLLSELRDG